MKVVIPTFCNLHPDYKQDLKYRIKDFFVDNFYWPVKQFFRKVIKIIQYVPTLWNDYDWDYSYIYKLLKYKLERSHDAIDDGFELPKSRNERLKPLKRCIILLENLIRDNYCERELNNYYSKNKPKWTKEENGSMVLSKDSNWKIVNKIYKKQETLRTKDSRELFDLLHKNIRTWWS